LKGQTGCPATLADWTAWRDQSVKALLTPRVVNGNLILDTQQTIAQSVAIANFIDDCSPSYQPSGDLDSVLKNLKSFTSTLRNILSIPSYDHQFGYTISDFDYLDRTRENVDLPPLLKSADFLKKVSNRETYKDAYDMIMNNNNSLPPDKQWTVLLYKSRFLTSPDYASTYGRFFVLVPEDKYDKWIQFGIKVPGDTSTIPINNLSIVSVARPDNQGRRFNAIIDWWRTYDSGWSVKLQTRRESQGITEACIMCHKTSPLGIHPQEEYLFDAQGALAVNTSSAGSIPDKLNSQIATYGPPYFNGWADPTSYGPALGPDITRSDATIAAWAANPSLSTSSIGRVKAAMNCSICHSEYGLGLLNFPETTRHLKSAGNQIYQYITNGWMPPGNDLTAPERAALYECLMKEYFDFDKGEGLFVDWLKNEHQSKMLLREASTSKRSQGSGERDFNANCLVCHSKIAGQNGFGPSLFGVVGRKSGTAPGYTYSSSYVEAGNKGVIWDDDALLQFLNDPAAYLTLRTGHTAVTRMRMKFPDEALRKSIIEYLKTLH
jgi:cytochrome c2